MRFRMHDYFEQKYLEIIERFTDENANLEEIQRALIELSELK